MAGMEAKDTIERPHPSHRPGDLHLNGRQEAFASVVPTMMTTLPPRSQIDMEDDQTRKSAGPVSGPNSDARLFAPSGMPVSGANGGDSQLSLGPAAEMMDEEERQEAFAHKLDDFLLDGGNAPAAPPTAAEIKGDHLGERILSSGNGQRENADFGNHSRLTS